MHNLSGTRLPGVQLTGSCNIISPNCKMYFSDLTFQKKTCICLRKEKGCKRAFAKYICSRHKVYLSKVHDVFVQSTRCICPRHKMYLCKKKDVFVLRQLEQYYVLLFAQILSETGCIAIFF